jgi:rhamnulokinase
VAEYTNVTHTGLVSLATGDWSQKLLAHLAIPVGPLPPIVPAGTIIGAVTGELASLRAFSDTQLIVPACHDTASAIAGIATRLDDAAYICSGTWSLVGTVIEKPITTDEALAAGFTNQGAAGGGLCRWTPRRCCSMATCRRC